MTKQPLFLHQSIEDVTALVLAQFRAGQRSDYGELLRLQNAGLCSADDVRGIMQAVTFTRPGLAVVGKISKNSSVIEVVR